MYGGAGYAYLASVVPIHRPERHPDSDQKKTTSSRSTTSNRSNRGEDSSPTPKTNEQKTEANVNLSSKKDASLQEWTSTLPESSPHSVEWQPLLDYGDANGIPRVYGPFGIDPTRNPSFCINNNVHETGDSLMKQIQGNNDTAITEGISSEFPMPLRRSSATGAKEKLVFACEGTTRVTPVGTVVGTLGIIASAGIPDTPPSFRLRFYPDSHTTDGKPSGFLEKKNKTSHSFMLEKLREQLREVVDVPLTRLISAQRRRYLLQRIACELLFSSESEVDTIHQSDVPHANTEMNQMRIKYRDECDDERYEEFIRDELVSEIKKVQQTREASISQKFTSEVQKESNPNSNVVGTKDAQVCNTHIQSQSFAILLAFPDRDARSVFFKVLLCLKLPTFDRYSLLHPSLALQTSMLTERWRRHEVSNFDYLWHLNRLAGRTVLDLNQYPVFPWVIAYNPFPNRNTSNGQSAKPLLSLPQIIDVVIGTGLHPLAPLVFRDLRLPIGRLDPERWDVIRDRFECFTEVDAGIPAFHYGSHYSNAAATCFYLLRNQPFAALHVELQSGRFDVADRLFASVPSAWRSCLTSLSCFKELTPEFFYDPSFLRNSAKYPLGQTQEGMIVDNVELPEWANNSPEVYIAVNRLALESDYVSSNIHHWIDLIFGCKQRGDAARKAGNLFCHLTYEGAVDVTAIQDPVSREAALLQIQQFGQTPSQLFIGPHPARYPKAPFGRSSIEGDFNGYLMSKLEVAAQLPPMPRSRAEAEEKHEDHENPWCIVEEHTKGLQSEKLEDEGNNKKEPSKHLVVDTSANALDPSEVAQNHDKLLTVQQDSPRLINEPRNERVRELKSVVAAARAKADESRRQRKLNVMQNDITPRSSINFGETQLSENSMGKQHQRSQSVFFNKELILQPWNEDDKSKSDANSDETLLLEDKQHDGIGNELEMDAKDGDVDAVLEMEGSTEDKNQAELELLTALETLEAMNSNPILSDWRNVTNSNDTFLPSPKSPINEHAISNNTLDASDRAGSGNHLNATEILRTSDNTMKTSAPTPSHTLIRKRVRSPMSLWLPLSIWSPQRFRKNKYADDRNRFIARKSFLLNSGEVVCGVRKKDKFGFQRLHLFPGDVYSLSKRHRSRSAIKSTMRSPFSSPSKNKLPSVRRTQAILDAVDVEDEDHEPETETDEEDLLSQIDKEDDNEMAISKSEPQESIADIDIGDDDLDDDSLDVEDMIRKQAERAQRRREMAKRAAEHRKRKERISIRRERRRLWGLLRMIRRTGLTSCREHADLGIMHPQLENPQSSLAPCNCRLLDEMQAVPKNWNVGFDIEWVDNQSLGCAPWLRSDDVELTNDTIQSSQIVEGASEVQEKRSDSFSFLFDLSVSLPSTDVQCFKLHFDRPTENCQMLAEDETCADNLSYVNSYLRFQNASHSFFLFKKEHRRLCILRIPSAASEAFPICERVINANDVNFVELPNASSIESDSDSEDIESKDGDSSNDVLTAALCTTVEYDNQNTEGLHSSYSAFVLLSMRGQLRVKLDLSCKSQICLPSLWEYKSSKLCASQFATIICTQLLFLMGRPRAAFSRGSKSLALASAESLSITLFPLVETSIQNSEFERKDVQQANTVISVAYPTIYHLPLVASDIYLTTSEDVDNFKVCTLKRRGRIVASYTLSIDISDALCLLACSRAVKILEDGNNCPLSYTTDCVIDIFNMQCRFSPLRTYTISRILQKGIVKAAKQSEFLCNNKRLVPIADSLGISTIAGREYMQNVDTTDHIPKWISQLADLIGPQTASDVKWIPVNVNFVEGTEPCSPWSGLIIALQPILEDLPIQDEVDNEDESMDKNSERPELCQQEDEVNTLKLKRMRYLKNCKSLISQLTQHPSSPTTLQSPESEVQSPDFEQADFLMGPTVLVSISIASTACLVSSDENKTCPSDGEDHYGDSGIRLQVLPSPMNRNACFSKLPNSSLIACGLVDGSVSILSLPTLNEVARIDASGEGISVCSLSWRPKNLLLAETTRLTTPQLNLKSSKEVIHHLDDEDWNKLKQDVSLSPLYSRLPQAIEKERDAHLGNVASHEMLGWIESDSRERTLQALCDSETERLRLSKLSASAMSLLAVGYIDGKIRLYEINENKLTADGYRV